MEEKYKVTPEGFVVDAENGVEVGVYCPGWGIVLREHSEGQIFC